STLLIEQVVRRHPAVIAAAVYGVPDPRSGDRVMAAIEVADPDAFDVTEFAEFLSAQDDLGSKGAPRLLRVSGSLPVTGSNKVLKRELQEQRWHTDELLYRWFGRGKPEYEPLTDSGKMELEAEFVSFGRANLF
ncbi:acyl-CoA synthetase, partial [Nocardia tengchongensis]